MKIKGIGPYLKGLLQTASMEETVPASHFGFGMNPHRHNFLPLLNFRYGLVDWKMTNRAHAVFVTAKGVKYAWS